METQARTGGPMLRNGQPASGEQLGKAMSIICRVLRRFNSETQLRVIRASLALMEPDPPSAQKSEPK